MKAITKFTYAGLLVAALVLASGCGSDDKKKDLRTNNPNGTTFDGGTNVGAHALLMNVRNGEYADTGYEHPVQDLFTNKNPERVTWYTRVQFINEDGTVVNPSEFNHPKKQYHVIRMILENDRQPGIRYAAEGKVYFKHNTGAIFGGQRLNGRSADGKPFSIYFGSDWVPGHFGLRASVMTGGGRVMRNFGVATITLETAAGKRIISY